MVRSCSDTAGIRGLLIYLTRNIYLLNLVYYLKKAAIPIIVANLLFYCIGGIPAAMM